MLTVEELMLHIDLRSDGPPLVVLSCTMLLHNSLLEMQWYQVLIDPPDLPIGAKPYYTSIVPSAN